MCRISKTVNNGLFIYLCICAVRNEPANMNLIIFYFLILAYFCNCDDYFINSARERILMRKSNMNGINEISMYCLKDLIGYVQDLENKTQWAIDMSEYGAEYFKYGRLIKGAWSNLRLADFGKDYEACLNLKYENITGSFCIINFYLQSYIKGLSHDQKTYDKHKTLLHLFQQFENMTLPFVFAVSKPHRLRLAACLPDSCTPDILNELDLLPENNEVAHCHTKKQIEEYRSLSWLDISFLFFLALIVVSMAISTVKNKISKLDRHQSNITSKLLSAFDLFEINKEIFGFTESKSQIGQLIGIRAICTLILMLLHCFSYIYFQPISTSLWFNLVNEELGLEESIFLQLFFAVDVFYLMSGILLVNGYLKNNQKKSGSILKLYARRYLRLTPLIAVTAWYYTTFLRNANYFNDTLGPLWHEDPKGDGLLYYNHRNCRINGWAALFHVQNLLYPFDLCMMTQWYSATEMQLILISPIFLIFLTKKSIGHGRKVKILLCTIITTTFSLFLFYYYFNFNAVFSTSMKKSEFFPYFYINPITRSVSWIIGLTFGYLLYNSKENDQLNKWLHNSFVRRIFWIVSGIIIFLLMVYPAYIPERANPSPQDYRLLHSLMGAIQRPLFVTLIGLMIYILDVITPKSKVNRFLSNHVFQILSKISFACYVTQEAVLLHKISYTLDTHQIYKMTLVAETLGAILMMIFVGTLATIFIEVPFLKIQNIIIPRDGAQGQNGDIIENKCIKNE